MVKQAEGELIEWIVSKFRPYAGSESNGLRSVNLLCSVPKCYRDDRIEIGWCEWPSEAYEKRLRKTAERFISRGWGFADGPICPDCRLGRRPESK